MSKKQTFNLKDWTNINKHNYQAYGIQSHKKFLEFKRRLKQDLENNPLTFSKFSIVLNSESFVIMFCYFKCYLFFAHE